jgi:rhamnosyltransferase
MRNYSGNCDSRPTVCVLMTAFNGANWIFDQINSILNQENVDVTIYISIDISQDETINMVEQISFSNKNIIIMPYGERFGGAARNFFRLIRDVDFSNYDFVALADQDDVWMKGKLSRATSIIQLNNYSAFSSDVLAFWPNGKTKIIKKSYPKKKFDHFYEAAGPGCTYVFKSQSFALFKDFLISKWTCVCTVSLHDWMIYAFFINKNLRWYIDDVPMMFYRQHSSNQVGINMGFKAYLKRFNLIKSKWYKCEVLKITSLLNVDAKSKCFIILNFWQFRRRFRDAFVFLLMNIFFIY